MEEDTKDLEDTEEVNDNEDIDNEGGEEGIKENLAQRISNSVQQIKNSVQKILQRLRDIFKLIMDLLSFIVSPHGLIIIATIVLCFLVYEGSKVVGPISFKEYCNEDGVPDIKNIEKEYKLGAIAGYFVKNNAMSSEVASYLALTLENADWEKIEGSTCEDTECLYKELTQNIMMGNPNVIKIGPLGLSGTEALKLVVRAKNSKKEWLNKELQLIYIKEKVLKENNINDEKRAKEGIKNVSRLFGKTLSEAELNEELAKAKEFAENNKVSLGGCVSMGQGGNKSRQDGGEARDGSIASLDMSNLITFLESVCLENLVSANGTNGASLATPEMIEGKNLAEEKGGSGHANWYASCDRLVAMALKAVEVDIEFPWGSASYNQIEYLKSSPKWEEISCEERQSGDIIHWGKVGSGHGHIAIYGVNDKGEEREYQASYKSYIPRKTAARSCEALQRGSRPITVWRKVE